MNHLLKSRLSEAYTRYLPLPATLEPHLKQALSRVLQNPGSMKRPEIVVQVALGYGVPENSATDMAIALEYFHTASLLFDDLPAMDDAMERRGAPCAHIEFGDAAAMLAALALVNRAYALTWKAIAPASPSLQRRALAYVESHLGVDGLLNGQSMDLHYASLPHDQRTTEQAAIGKTVSLIRLTLVLPAMLGGASDRELHLLERVALFWGLSYQIVDDLKDVLQSANESGKTPSRDLALGRPNLALTLGIQRAAERLQRLMSLGDRTLNRTIAARPSLLFLRDLRRDLSDAAAPLTQSICPAVSGGTR